MAALRSNVPTRSRAGALAVVVLAMLVGSGAASAATWGPFSNPQLVSIEGYAASAQEPFITPDGRYLLFNSSEAVPDFSLQFATRVGAQEFQYQGAIRGEGVNDPEALSGTPSLDQDGELYFISTRSYFETLSTVYSGRFAEGEVSGVHLVPGVSAPLLGQVDFDVGVSPSGSELYVSAGQFGEAGAPTSARIAMFARSGSGFVADAAGEAMLDAVNAVGALDYAADVSSDELELFFTAASPAVGAQPAIYRATRTNTGAAFGNVERVAAITGFAEAPSLSADGSTLYYHEQVGSEFQVMTVTRAENAPTVTKVSPKAGIAAGGSAVTIRGTNLTGASTVMFGAIEATELHVESASELTVLSPAGSTGTTDVTVRTPQATSPISAKDHFRYQGPTVTGLTPSAGPTAGANTVTVHGSGFALGAGATTFEFAHAPASAVDCPSSTSCTVLAPAGKAGTVDVTASVNAKRSKKERPGEQYTYE